MRNLRTARRFDCYIYGHVIQEGFEVPCHVVDISAGGAKIIFDTLSAASARDRPFEIDIPGIGRYPGRFRWRAGERAGLAFTISELRKASLATRLADVFES